MKKKNGLSKEQVDLFKLCVSEYANLLNLRDWRVEVSDKAASKGAMADCTISLEDHLAVIRIGTDWGGSKVTDLLVRQTVVHELLHVLIRPLMEASIARDNSAIASAEHSLITILEKLLAA